MKRKSFIRLSAIGAVSLATPFQKTDWLGRKLKIGLIGSGWYGMVVATSAMKSGGATLIGICDADTEHLKSAADEAEKLQGKRPETFKNHEDLLEMKGLDAVIIGTIPHWHALQFIAACKKGLNIYCEKPLAYDVTEGEAMVAAAREAGNLVQVGFQRRQAGSYKKVKELIGSGRVGQIHQVNARIHYNPGKQDTSIQDPPASLDWEQWCGPAPKLAYRPSIGHRSWRLEKEYGNGHLVDWGIHHIDIIRKILDEDMPIEFHTTGGLNVLKDQITTPDTLTSIMHFKSVPVIWQHRLWGNGDVNGEFNNGIFFYGENGTIFADDSRVVIYPTGKDSKPEEIKIETPRMQDIHVEGFLNAVRKNDPALISCTPEDAFKSTATVQLAMISYYTGTTVKWDPSKQQIIDNQEASKLLKREYRGKYRHP